MCLSLSCKQSSASKLMKKFILLTSISFYLFCFKPSIVLAVDETFRLDSSQVIDTDFVRLAKNIQIDGNIRGDVFLIGGSVTVNGNIDGDLFIIAGKAVINGNVQNNLRLLSADAIVNGQIGRNVLGLCYGCSFSKLSDINGSFIAVANSLDLGAKSIHKGIRFIGNKLYMNGIVSGDTLVVIDEEFLLGPTASISGNLKRAGAGQFILEPGATVSGIISYQQDDNASEFPRFFGTKALLQWQKKLKPITDLFGFVINVLIGFVLLGLFPKSFEKGITAIETQPYGVFGWGLLIAFMVPLLTILFALTIVGLPVSILILIISYSLWIVGQYLIAFFIGRKVLLKRFGERRGWSIFVGLLVFYLFGKIPYLGFSIQIMLIIFALGAMVLSTKHRTLIEENLVPTYHDKKLKVKFTRRKK